MMPLRHWLVLASVAALANGGPVQLANLQLPSCAATHQQAVVDLFVESYKAYQSVSFWVQLTMVLTCDLGHMHGVTMNYFQSRCRIPMI